MEVIHTVAVKDMNRNNSPDRNIPASGYDLIDNEQHTLCGRGIIVQLYKRFGLST